MSKSEKTALVPKLRFPEFSEEWRSMFFENAFGFLQTNVFSRSQMNTQRGRVRNIHYGDVLIKYGYVLGDVSTLPFINEDICLDKYNRNSYLQSGDVVIADTAEDLTAGKALEVQNANCDILAGLHTMLCRPKRQAAPGYWGYYINSPAYHNNIIPLITGSKVSSISKSNIIKTSVVTTCFVEQQKIADCLSSLDELIAVENKKLEALKMHKKGLMKKLFPSEGKTVPAVRFLGFTDAWKQRKIENCFAERNERSSKGELISVTMNSGVMKASDLGRHDTSSDDKSNYKRVEVGDIAYNSMRMWQGASGYSPYSGILSPAYTVITPNDDIYSPFFAYLFKRPDMIHTFKICSQGLTSDTWNLKWPALSAIPAIVPTFAEQEKISGFFAALDRLITLHQRKVESLKIHKKGLMQGLFPSVKEVIE